MDDGRRTLEPGELAARDRTCVWHPYTQHRTEATPLEVVGARGSLLRLADGREIVDGISSWWTCLHGHGHPRLVEALAAQARELDHVIFAGATHEPGVRLAEQLTAIAPGPLTRVFFSDNGSSAVEIALKMAFQHHLQRGESERRVFVTLEGGYHGDTFGAMSVGDPDPFFEPFRPLLFDVRRVPADADAIEAALEDLGPRAAGVLMEPLVQGAGGMAMHGAELVRSARASATRHGVPLIADEVMTGFGRTGELFACAKAGVEPDLLCLAKGLTGGMMPLAVTLAREELFESFLSDTRARAFFHGHSFTGHALGCAVALASLEVVRDEGTPAKLERIGAAIEARLIDALPEEIERPRRTGGIVAFDLPVTSGASGYLSELGPLLRQVAIDRGVLLRPLGNVVYALPPASLSDDEVEGVVGALVASAESALGSSRRST
ncbi:Adenosylmethionine-8-amino-7-oxononanoate aminotransferase [Planctomycetes bacterium Pla163]|uniref:Adenosylmethionine-8-amino-7-oxononanoate aminotransferase n=1 Tax=Rohdeia mirabilis TaxID=2528008 RepID=A0A518D4L4_9BACT|nr:Adenosylmethionine-8-amino-7-oxononanoate aminotransferase [Planctomycetes bacterium Pla163]